MIAIDSNVLLRYLLGDDKVQSPKANRLILNSAIPILVTDVVLAETIWTLTGKRYKLAKPDIIAVLDALFAEPDINFEDDQVVWQALRDFENASPIKTGQKKKLADFQDALILNKAIKISESHGEPLSALYSFDTGMQDLHPVESP